jgi:hypothetical protein
MTSMVAKKISQPHEVRYLDGSKINWKKPPKATQICSWTKKTTSGKKIKGSFRTLCHLNRLNNLSLQKFSVQISVIQPDWNTSVPMSAGTHDYDACWDVWIPGVAPDKQERFFRANGLGGWMRKPPLFSWHYHGFTLPQRTGQIVSNDFAQHGFRVGIYVDGGFSTRGKLVTSSQISDYYEERNGLKGHAKAGGWFPSNKTATIFDLNSYVARRAKRAA